MKSYNDLRHLTSICDILRWHVTYHYKWHLFKEDMKEVVRGSMTNRSRELAPGSRSLVRRQRTLTTGLRADECYVENSSVCRRTERPKRGVKVKKV